MKRSKRSYRAPRRREAPRSRSGSAASGESTVGLGLLRVTACGIIFVTLVALKLLLPDNMAGVRGTLGSWLVRDADFEAAFSAVGHAVSGEGGVVDSLEDAYTAVFGTERQEAKEVSGQAEIERDIRGAAEENGQADAPEPDAPDTEGGTELLSTRSLPAHAVAEQHILGFSYAAPLTGTVTSAFGWRTHPATGRESFHYGTDLAAEEGTDVLSFADGVVGVVAESTELGSYVTVHHGDGITTLYAHLSRVTVSSGARVAKGGKLGEVGSTGNATGPHLHFEVHDGEDYLDPAYYLS